MFLTLLLQAKAKSKNVLVLMESVGSGHLRYVKRKREDDIKARIMFDRTIQMPALYKEIKKIRSLQ